jgi:hypothetical protein
MSKHERWALGADMRGATEDVAGKGRMSTLRIEKSFGHQYTSAVYIIAEGGDGMGQTLNTHLTADDAEGIATVLLFLADKWRKENT